MTKVEAIRKVLEDNSGTATWQIIYNNIEKYYPQIKLSKQWQAGIRGVLYRELENGKLFKKIGLGIFALKDYAEEDKREIKKDTIRMHSFIQGICIELGNIDKNHLTYTADPSATYKDNIFLSDLTTLQKVPPFSYPEIVNVTKRIDVSWFNANGFRFPRKVFEVIDSIGTLGDALNRMFQLLEFNVKLVMIGRKQFENRFNKKMQHKPYNEHRDRYTYKTYEELICFYEKKMEIETMKF